MVHFDPHHHSYFRRCFLIGLHCNRPAVVLFDCRYPCLRNFDSTISSDFIWMKCVPIRVTINTLDFVPNSCSVPLACSEIAEVCVPASRMFLSCSFIRSLVALLVSNIRKESCKQYCPVLLVQGCLWVALSRT